MASNRRPSLKVAFVLFLIASLTIPVLRLAAQNGPVSDHAGGSRDRVEVVLHAGPAPTPGGTAEMTLEARPYADVPDLVVRWLLPAGATLIGETEERFGQVGAGQTVTSKRQVRFDTTGVYKVAAAAVLDYGPDLQYGASGVVFYTIDPLLSAVSDMDPGAHSSMGTIMPTMVTSTQEGMTRNQATGDPCFNISGTVTRWERSPQPSGYVDSTGVPVRAAYVEIREDDSIFDDTYAQIYTDDSGFFQYSFCDDDGLFGGDNLELYVRLHAEIFEGSHKVAEIEDSSWIDEIYYYDSDTVSSSGGTHTFDFTLDVDQSAVFNIADAILDAWRMWRDSGGQAGGDSLFDGEGEVHWEPGYGDDGSYYNPFWNEITIADDPSDPDAWDDPVIIHEWNHMADDYYSCDDNPGGAHRIGELAASTDLAWGEGYGDYWQSAVRTASGQPAGNRYIDINGSGSLGINVNLELTQAPDLVSVQYEMAIASALWDIFDTTDDGQDTISLGHAPIQAVYTGDDFDDIASGFFDDTCNFDTYARAWVASGQPADGPTAAVIMQNTGYTLPPPTFALDSVGAAQAGSPIGPTTGVWWNQLTYVIDNSKSMAGAKFDAVKTVLAEAINDLAAAPQGTEFTLLSYDNNSLTQTPRFAGQFFPDRLAPAVAGLTTSNAADSNCLTLSLHQLNQAVQGQQGGHVWLFTDGDTLEVPSVENMKLTLNERDIRASIALLGGCPTLAASDVTAEAVDAQGQIALQGAMQRYLGLAADAAPTGIVPYLLTAINSGGSFLFVDPAMADAAADILRAQITHSAGAGTWSDYVSDQATYRWDRLASWEYNWIDATAGKDHGAPEPNSFLDIALPAAFTYYGQGPYSAVRAYEKGYLTFGGAPYGANQPANTMLPNNALPNNAIYPYWDNLDWQIFCLQSPEAPECGGPPRKIYSRQQGPWFAIEQKDYYATGFVGYLDFQTQLNLQTGEIRFLYNDLDGVGAPSATIGLENANGSAAVQISYNDVSGASAGMGYKLLPAPPQPNKTYTAVADKHMSGIAFLLTGYSGTFEKLVVKYPDGQPVNCADTANVLCLDLGLVQYVQANINGRYGAWQAIVDAGPSGEGTFSLSSMAASAISAKSITPHNMGTVAGSGIVVDMGKPLGGVKLNGRFVRPDNQPFGSAFEFFDDGVHQDGRAGDGIYGSSPYTPQGMGTAYLHVTGTYQGASFERTDPVPFSFQPVTLESLGNGASGGGATQLQFRLTNLDTVAHGYALSASLPLNWSINISNSVKVNAGQSLTINASTTMGPNTAGLPSGASGEVVLSATEEEQGVMAAAASAVVTRHRLPAAIDIFNNILYLRPGGEKGQLAFYVVDEQGVGVADGTQVSLSATKGTISPPVAVTKGGYFTAEFSSGGTPGTAVVTAQLGETTNAASAAVTAQTEIEIGTPKPSNIALSTQATTLPPGAVTTLTAVVTDRYGTPMAGQKVRIGVSGDGQKGTVGGKEVVSGVANSSGVFSVSFQAGLQPGYALARAELLATDGPNERVVHDDSQQITVSSGVFLPIIKRP